MEFCMDKILQNKTVVLGVTGSIAAYSPGPTAQ